MKNLSNRELTQPQNDALAKGLNLAVTPEEILVVDLITATESAIRNQPTDTETEKLRLKVTAALANANESQSDLTADKRKALASLKKD